MPKVSVIIPVYNVEKYLRECLDSVINQTLKDIEIICVDDGSTDSSLSILKEYAQKDNRVVVLTQKNLHAGIARNTGLNIATGEWVHFLDSDDWVELNTYEELYKIATSQDANVIKFKCYSYDDKKKEIMDWAYTDIRNIPDEFFDNYLTIDDNCKQFLYLPDSPWSGLYNLEFLKKNNIKFDNLLCANDTSFYFHCAFVAKRIYLSSSRFVYYRRNIDTSLIGIRPKNFDCQIKQFNIINNLLQNENEEVRRIVRERLVVALFNRFKTYITDNNIPVLVKHKIWSEMENFVRENRNLEQVMKYLPQYLGLFMSGLEFYIVLSSKVPVTGVLFKIAYCRGLVEWQYCNDKKVLRIKLDEILKNVCSICKEKEHNVLTVLGIKVKIRRKSCAKG